MPVPAEVLDQTELRENLAEAIVDFWKDADGQSRARPLTEGEHGCALAELE